MIDATMPSEHASKFRPKNMFPPSLIAKAEAELDMFASILEENGIKVYRPSKDIDWLAEDGYTGAMPRDGLMSVGNTLIEACFAWPSRSKEIQIGFTSILDQLALDPRVKVIRRPRDTFANTLLDDDGTKNDKWVINNSRPAFDTADFMRFGTTIIGQLSHVTNQAGVDWLTKSVPNGYTVELIEVNDPNAMHIDATILPLRQGLLVFNPKKVTEKALRKHTVLANWELRPYPFTPESRVEPPFI
ncbi:hypothetical protein N7535_009229 [Penicillium sp. DV-2018c]|nr:hypothetical protein N7535_009229 [Penicillium sp. DV-2018c]